MLRKVALTLAVCLSPLTATADQWGLVTVNGLRLTKAKTRLRLAKP